jgi:UPF0755 protein
VLLLVVVIGSGLLALLRYWGNQVPSGEQRSLAVMLDAESLSASGAHLAELGLVESPWLFALYARVFWGGESVPAGEHFLSVPLSARELSRQLTRSLARERVKLAVPEGYNHVQIAERLERQGVCSAAAFRSVVRDPVFLRELSIRGPSAEGYLFPATYELYVNSVAGEVGKTLVAEAKKRVTRLRAAHSSATAPAQKLRWDDQDVLTLASVVEKEVANPAERPLVASVFFNRLTDESFRPKHMLQSDPTASYGCIVEPTRSASCSGFAGQVTPAMLRDATNRYNTYAHAGLPPGPISNPGEAAISAVLNPTASDYLFFVSNGRGGHTFSRTFAEHTELVDQSRKAAP